MISEFPLFVFTLLGGAAAGAYAFSAVFPEKANDSKKGIAFPLTCLILLAVSGLCLLAHLGHPERMFNAFSNFSAGITQEGIAMIAFGLVTLADVILVAAKGVAPRWLRIVGGVLGVLLLAAMANAYGQLLNVPAAATFAIAPFFVVGGLALGGALYGMFTSAPYQKGAYLWTSVVIAALMLATLIAMGLHFTSIDLNSVPFIVGAIVGPVAAAVVMLVCSKANKSWGAAAVLALMLVGVAIARYAFYAVA